MEGMAKLVRKPSKFQSNIEMKRKYFSHDKVIYDMCFLFRRFKIYIFFSLDDSHWPG